MNTKYEEISKETGIPTWEFEVAMGRTMKKCLAETAESAQKEYLGADGESEERAAALLRWVEMIETPEQAEEVFEETVSGSDVERLLLVKWAKMLKTSKEVKGVLDKTPEGSDVEMEVQDILNRRLLEEIRATKNYEDARDLWNMTKEGTKMDKVALIKRAELATTFEEAFEVFNDTTTETLSKNTALKRLVELWDKKPEESVKKE